MSALKIKIIEDPDGFEGLEGEWSELLRASAANSLFLSWEWLWTWWKHLAEGRKLFLVTVRRGRELVAIAPFVLRSWKLAGLIPCRSLEFLGTGSVGSDYLDLIIQRREESEVCRLLADYLAQERLIVVLTHLNRRSNLAARLPRSCKRADGAAPKPRSTSARLSICQATPGSRISPAWAPSTGTTFYGGSRTSPKRPTWSSNPSSPRSTGVRPWTS